MKSSTSMLLSLTITLSLILSGVSTSAHATTARFPQQSEYRRAIRANAGPRELLSGPYEDGPGELSLDDRSEFLGASGLQENVGNVNFVHHIGGEVMAVHVAEGRAYLGEGAAMTILDVSTTITTPTVLGKTELLPGPIEDLDLSGDSAYAYVVTGDGCSLEVVNVMDPAKPRVVASYSILEGQRSKELAAVDVHAQYAYVAVKSRGLSVVDVNNPLTPFQVGLYNTGSAYDVYSNGIYAYLATYGKLTVVDVTDPRNPTEKGYCDIPGTGPYGVAVSGDYAYVAAGYAGLRVVDVSDPAYPSEIGFYDTPGSAWDVFVGGDIAYVADWDTGLRLVDVSNPSDPVEVGACGTPGTAREVFVDETVAYVGDRYDGLRVVDVGDPTTPREIGFYYTLGTAESLMISENSAYVGGNGLWIGDISDPTTPTKLGSWDQASPVDIDVVQSVAYLADASYDLQAIDVSDPAGPVKIGQYRTPGNTWGVDVRGDLAYVAAGTAGLRIVDVSNPPEWVEIGFCDTPGFAGDVALSGDIAYLVDGEAGLRVVNINDPTAPAEIGFHDTPDRAAAVALSDSVAYVADNEAGLRILDVSDPSSPTEVGSYDTPGWAHDVVVSSNVAYVADYYEGLRVIGVSDPANPIEIGFYDTPGQAVSVAVAGDYVYVGDGNDGLLTLMYSAGDLAVVGTSPASEATGVSTTTSQISAQFSKPVYPPSLNTLTVFLWDGETHVPGAVDYRPSDNMVVLQTEELAPGTRYRVILTGNIVAADDQNQHLAPYAWEFTTEGSERDRLIEALRELNKALVQKIAYDAEILSIDFTLARELHKQKAFLDFLGVSSDIFLLWAGKDPEALFGLVNDFADIVGVFGLGAKTAGLIENAEQVDYRLTNVVELADLQYTSLGGEFDTLGYRNYFRDAVMGTQSPVNSIPLLSGPLGTSPSVLDRACPDAIQSSITSQFDALIEGLPERLPIGLDAGELIEEIRAVTASVQRSVRREEEVDYSAYFPGYFGFVPQRHWLGAVAQQSAITSGLASAAVEGVKADAELAALKTAMAGAKLVLIVSSAGAAATAEVVYVFADVAMLPNDITEIRNQFSNVDPHLMLDQHVYRMVLDYGRETGTAWRIANDVIRTIDYRVDGCCAYATEASSSSLPELTIGGLELDDIELDDDMTVGTATGAATVSNSSSAPLRAMLTGHVDTPLVGSSEDPIITVFGSESAKDIAPGATKALTFTYSVFPSTLFGVEGYNAQASIQVVNLETLERSEHGPVQAHFFAGRSAAVEASKKQAVRVPMSGTISVGQECTGTLTLQPSTQKVRIRLVQDSQSDLDLHIYDELGRHVGYDYTNSTEETTVPDATYSGRDVRAEWIEVSPVTTSHFTVKVAALNANSATRYVIVAIETPELPAVVVTFPDYLVSQTEEPTTTIGFSVREIGEQSGLTEVKVSASDLRGGPQAVIPRGKIRLAVSTTTLVAGGALDVRGEVTMPENLPEGTYTGKIDILGKDSSSLNVVTTTLPIVLTHVKFTRVYLPLTLRD